MRPSSAASAVARGSAPPGHAPRAMVHANAMPVSGSTHASAPIAPSWPNARGPPKETVDVDFWNTIACARSGSPSTSSVPCTCCWPICHTVSAERNGALPSMPVTAAAKRRASPRALPVPEPAGCPYRQLASSSARSTCGPGVTHV